MQPAGALLASSWPFQARDTANGVVRDGQEVSSLNRSLYYLTNAKQAGISSCNTFFFIIIIIFFIVVDFVIYWNETAMSLHVPATLSWLFPNLIEEAWLDPPSCNKHEPTYASLY